MMSGSGVRERGQDETAKATGEQVILAIGTGMQRGLEPLVKRVLVPCVYRVYLHADVMDRLARILPQMEADAVDYLNQELARLNGSRRSSWRRLFDRWNPLRDRLWSGRPHELAGTDWSIEFQEDPEGKLDPGAVTVLTVLAPRPSRQLTGQLTQRVIATTRRLGRTTIETYDETVPPPAATDAKVPARALFHYEDDSGRHVYAMTTDVILIGRDAANTHVDLDLKTSHDVSREHARVRYLDGRFAIQDLSTFGTWVDGRRVPPARAVEGGEMRDEDVWEELRDGAKIDLASSVILEFEAVGR